MTQNDAPQEGLGTEADPQVSRPVQESHPQMGEPTERLEGMRRVHDPRMAPQAPGPYGPTPSPVPAPPSPYGQAQNFGQSGVPYGAQHTSQFARPQQGPYAPAPAAPRTELYGGQSAFYPGQTPSSAPRPERARKIWPTVVGTAAVTALLVGGGTAAALIAILDDGPTPAASAPASAGTDASKITVTDLGSANWEATAAKVAPSVVAIQVKGEAGAGQGSGFIIDDAGHILTNDHVVAGAVDDTVQVALSDGRLLKATIVGLDPTTDLAVIALVDAPSGLMPVTIANSDDVVVGNAVMAVGNPLGLANTVTTGIVSAIDRPVSTSGEAGTASPVVTNAIQIDAAINPGNSGGPLFNASGEVIGITSSIASMSNGSGQAGSIGLGFAIPSNLARSIGDQLIDKGMAEHAVLGVVPTDETATADGTTRLGAGIQNVSPDSPAAQAGLQAGDVVTALDGEPMSGAESLAATIRERAAGDVVELTVVRDGKSLTLKATLAAQPDAVRPARDTTPPAPGNDSGAPSGIPEDFFNWFNNR